MKLRLSWNVNDGNELMLYEKLKKAWDQADVDAYKALHHEDFTFTFHSTGRVMTRDDMTDQGMKGMMMTVKNTHQRCIYENDDILVEHAFSEFPSGDKEAVMMVSLKKTASSGAQKLVRHQSENT